MTEQVPEDLRRRLVAVCEVAGLEPDPFRLLKFTNNAVFELPEAGIVVRIAGSEAMHYRARKIVTVGRWLEAQEFPAIRLQPGIEQPLAAGDDLATIWVWAQPTGGETTMTDLGELLARFHRLPDPVEELPDFDPIGDIRVRLDRADGLGDDDLEFLKSRCAELDVKLAHTTFELPRGPIHGDAHPGNLIRTANVVLVADFDSTCMGPPEWDLTPTLFGVDRFGDPAMHLDELVAAYGTDPRQLTGSDVLMKIRELKLISSVVPVLGTNLGVVDQFNTRLRSLRENDNGRWSRY